VYVIIKIGEQQVLREIFQLSAGIAGQPVGDDVFFGLQSVVCSISLNRQPN